MTLRLTPVAEGGEFNLVLRYGEGDVGEHRDLPNSGGPGEGAVHSNCAKTLTRDIALVG